MICILVSLKKEIEPFLETLTETHGRRVRGTTLREGSHRGIPVRIAVTGMGAGTPPETLQGCTVVVSTGFCGALQPDMRCGDPVVSREVTYAGKELLERITGPRVYGSPFEGTGLFRLRLSERLGKHLAETARESGLTLHEGRSVSCARVIRTEMEKRKLEAYFDALAVDMEDYLRVCAARSTGIEALSVRAVLDELVDEVPSFRGGVKLRGAVSLYRKIPRVQRSLALLLGETLSFLADTMEIV